MKDTKAEKQRNIKEKKLKSIMWHKTLSCRRIHVENRTTAKYLIPPFIHHSIAKSSPM